MLGSVEDDLADKTKKLQADLAKTQKELKEAWRDVGGKKTGKMLPDMDVTQISLLQRLPQEQRGWSGKRITVA